MNLSFCQVNAASSKLYTGKALLKGRTVVVVAHRLSTVKFADLLIVLDKGEVVESGSHIDLTFKKGAYYTLVKNQLELE